MKLKILLLVLVLGTAAAQVTGTPPRNLAGFGNDVATTLDLVTYPCTEEELAGAQADHTICAANLDTVATKGLIDYVFTEPSEIVDVQGPWSKYQDTIARDFTLTYPNTPDWPIHMTVTITEESLYLDFTH